MIMPKETLKEGWRKQQENTQEKNPLSKGLKTIKQVADGLGVSKQTVYRYVKRECINEVLQEGGVMYIDEALQNRIEEWFLKNATSDEASHDSLHDAGKDAARSELLEETIKVFREQLEAKDQQIKSLHKELATEREHARHQSVELAKLADQAQQLQAMHNTSMQKFLGEGKKENQSFWKKLFRRDNKEDTD